MRYFKCSRGNELRSGVGFQRQVGHGSDPETKADTIFAFIHGLRGSLQVTFEEGTCAAWLHALLKPQLTQVVVCDPRKNARKLAELLRSNLLRSVFHKDMGLRSVKELARSYLTITKDLTRVMSRLKAIYRSWPSPVPVSKFTHFRSV